MTARPARLRLLHGDEADVFREHELALRRGVRRAVAGPDAVVDDACAFAWLQFLRGQPDRATALGWLRTVAIREAWRLTRIEQHDAHLEQIPNWEQLHGRDTLEPTVDAHQLLQSVADLPHRQRRALLLLAGGHSYAEIATATDGTRDSVNSHLRRARRNLRVDQ